MSAADVTAAAITASAIDQQAGTGTTTFNGAVNTDGAGGVDLDGTAFAINATVTTTNDGVVTITNSGALTIAAAGGHDAGRRVHADGRRQRVDGG